MRGILKEEGVPEDLVYVAMIESAFKYQAHSRAAAHGFWQFIAGHGQALRPEAESPRSTSEAIP